MSRPEAPRQSLTARHTVPGGTGASGWTMLPNSSRHCTGDRPTPNRARDDKLSSSRSAWRRGKWTMRIASLTGFKLGGGAFVGDEGQSDAAEVSVPFQRPK